jgi:hypothetical protein
MQYRLRHLLAVDGASTIGVEKVKDLLELCFLLPFV